LKTTTKRCKKLNNDRELEKSHSKLRTIFNSFIRLRDLRRDEQTGEITGVCISCGTKWIVGLYSDKSIINTRGGWVAGHLWKDKKYASVRYDERNLNLQCAKCNTYLSGNESNYAENLKKKIGKKEVEKLNVDRNKIKHWDILEIDRMCFEYKDKLHLEAKRLGIKI